ncbi:MAG: type IV pilin protein [Deltaproteobacteria bacterium]
MKRCGFTLIEMLITVVVLGILATIALPRYVRIVERSRSAEARNALGVIRDAELAYFMENNVFTASVADLNVPLPTACNATYYFAYSIVTAATDFTASAARCTAGQGGREPAGAFTYTLTLNRAGTMASSVADML